MMKIKIAAAVCAALLAGCGGQSASPLVQELRARNLELPRIIRLSDFTAACRKLSVVGADAVLDELGIPVRGEGDGAFLLAGDLLAACGDDCREDAGLGEVLKMLAAPRQKNR